MLRFFPAYHRTMPYPDRERQRRFQRDWMRARRVAWLAENGPCVRCGSDSDLQVDHRDPTRKVDHKVWSWRERRRSAELAKCQVLCGECHQRKTTGEMLGAGNHQAKLDDAGALEAHRLAGLGLTQTQIGERLGISQSQVGRILRGERWPHVYAAVRRERAA